jgi:hypothetical protein
VAQKYKKKGKYQMPSSAKSASPAAAAVPPAASVNDKADLDAILQTIEKERGRPCIVYWTTQLARISLAVETPLFDQLNAHGKQQAFDLVLFTNGGDAEAPLRIVSLIREYCETFSVLIPHRALSAGTLLVLGANEIVTTPFSVFGPIDPTRTHPLLPRREGATEPEPISVQDMRHAMQFIREAAPKESAVAYTPEAMAQIFSALFDKIHPLAIGAIEQSYALARLIGTRCLETHMGTSDADRAKISSIVDKLIDQYKSHSYPISRTEAELIGLNIVKATPAVESALNKLLAFYSARKVGPFGPQIAIGKEIKMHIAWLDSLKQKFRAEQEGVIGANNKLESRGDGWLPY